jgi:hypothetical protein
LTTACQLVNVRHLRWGLQPFQQFTNQATLTRQRSSLRPIHLIGQQQAKPVIIGTQILSSSHTDPDA